MKKLKVLIVEDGPTEAAAIAGWISSEGHDVTAAKTHVEALALIGGDYDIVLVDQLIPDTEPSQTYHILEYVMECPVIPMSAYKRLFSNSVSKSRGSIMTVINAICE